MSEQKNTDMIFDNIYFVLQAS